MLVVSFMKPSKSLQSALVTMADLAEGQLLKDGNGAKQKKVSEVQSANLETYVGHLESKERLRIKPAQLFNFS